MKKLLALLLAVLMVASFAACSSGGGSGDKGSTKGEISVFYYTFSDAYISTVRSSMDKILSDSGYTYNDYDANGNQTTQTEQVQTALAKGSSLLIVNVVDTGSNDAAQNIINLAKAKNVPVIFFNRSVEQSVIESYDKCVFVGTDYEMAGHMQGKMIGDYLVANYDAVDLNGDGVIQYAMFMGQLGNAEAIARTQFGVEDANAVLTAAGKPELEYFDASNSDKYQVDQDGAWSATAANAYMVTNLSQYNEANGNMIELVICNNDGMAEGAITALNDAGYNLGTADCVTIPVFGVDATAAAVQLISDGKMTGTIKQDAEGMANGIAHLVGNAAAGKEVMADTDSYVIDETVSNKIYIPYATYTGE